MNLIKSFGIFLAIQENVKIFDFFPRTNLTYWRAHIKNFTKKNSGRKSERRQGQYRVNKKSNIVPILFLPTIPRKSFLRKLCVAIVTFEQVFCKKINDFLAIYAVTIFFKNGCTSLPVPFIPLLLYYYYSTTATKFPEFFHFHVNIILPKKILQSQTTMTITCNTKARIKTKYTGQTAHSIECNLSFHNTKAWRRKSLCVIMKFTNCRSFANTSSSIAPLLLPAVLRAGSRRFRDNKGVVNLLSSHTTNI